MVVETTTELDVSSKLKSTRGSIYYNHFFRIIKVRIYTKLGFKVCTKTDIDSNIGKGQLFLMVKEM